jgi:hypothetical protein
MNGATGPPTISACGETIFAVDSEHRNAVALRHRGIGLALLARDKK